MTCVHPKVDELLGHPLLGAGQCAVLVETFAGAPKTSDWTQGATVRGSLLLAKGTVVDGVYSAIDFACR